MMRMQKENLCSNFEGAYFTPVHRIYSGFSRFSNFARISQDYRVLHIYWTACSILKVFITFPKKIVKQMIHQLRAPINSSLIHERNWAWHHSREGYAPLTEKAPLLLKLVQSHPQKKFFKVQNSFHLLLFRAFF